MKLSCSTLCSNSPDFSSKHTPFGRLTFTVYFGSSTFLFNTTFPFEFLPILYSSSSEIKYLSSATSSVIIAGNFVDATVIPILAPSFKFLALICFL